MLLKAVALEMLLWDPEQASFGIEEYVLPRFEVPLGETSKRFGKFGPQLSDVSPSGCRCPISKQPCNHTTINPECLFWPEAQQ